MAVSIPKLEIYYIEIDKRKKRSKRADIISTSTSSMVSRVLDEEPLQYLQPSRLLQYYLFIQPLQQAAWRLFCRNLGLSLTWDVGKHLSKLLRDERFHIITSEDELEKFENAHGNRWVKENQKNIFQSKQYYVRHPKKLNRNILIEANSFYDFIEEEQKTELLNFIRSHCSAKSIQIDRVEGVSIKGKAKANVKAMDIYGDIDYTKRKGNFHSYNNPGGAPMIEPLDNYVWLDKSLMISIAGLTEGSSMTQRYESDFTCGLSAGEAKTIGLDLNKHKKYIYTIHIEC